MPGRRPIGAVFWTSQTQKIFFLPPSHPGWRGKEKCYPEPDSGTVQGE